MTSELLRSAVFFNISAVFFNIFLSVALCYAVYRARRREKSAESQQRSLSQEGANTRLEAHISTGSRGRWRFTIRDRGGRCLAVGTARGYENETAARDAVRQLSESQIVVCEVTKAADEVTA